MKLILQQEKDKIDYLNESCKKYLNAYEQSKKEVDMLYLENDRLKTRLSDVKEISMAKEANYKMINHLGSLDQEYYQETIEKLRSEVSLLKEENKLLNEFTSAELNQDKKNILNIIKSRQQELISENHYLSNIKETLEKDLMKKNNEINEIEEKYNELTTKQLFQARLLVQKDEEIRFWKCTISELICGEVLNNYTKEEEYVSLINSTFDLSEKFLKIKDKLSKNLKMKYPQILSCDSDALISEKSFIFACVPCITLLSNLLEHIFEENDEIEVIFYKNLQEKIEIVAESCDEVIKTYEKLLKNSTNMLIEISGKQNLWIFDAHQSENIIKSVLTTVYSPENIPSCIRQALLTSESIYLLIE